MRCPLPPFAEASAMESASRRLVTTRSATFAASHPSRSRKANGYVVGNTPPNRRRNRNELSARSVK
jgi:hypothetical protein